MKDLEKGLQIMMHDKASQMSPSEVVPARTLRRTRNRQTLFASAAVASVLLVIVGAVSAGTRFRSQEDRGLAPVGPREAASCSSAGLSPDLEPQPGLPPKVEATRQAIVDAAVRCDYEALEALTGGRQMYSLHHGEKGNFDAPPAAEYWRELDEEQSIGGDSTKAYLFEPMRILVQLLDTPYTVRTFQGERYFEWPSVLADPKEVTESDWDALETVYSEEEVQEIRRSVEEFGAPYFGYRVSIREDGLWNSFWAGD